jgi:prophage regulatory protein
MDEMLSFKQVRKLVLYSRAHVDRLEKAGHFPKRIRLGTGRVGWWKREIMDWLEQQAQRSLTTP